MRVEAVRWIWLVALALPLSGPALADPPAPSEAAPPVRNEFRVALLDVPPGPSAEEAAAVIVAAVRAALHEDPRFDMVATEQVARARAAHEGQVDTLHPEEDAGGNALLSVKHAELTYAQACIIGREVGAQRIILLGGYDMGARTSVKEDPLRNALYQAGEHSTPSHPVKRPEIAAWVAASVQVMHAESCTLGEQATIRADRDSHVSELEALVGAEKDFGAAVRVGLQRLFPVRSTVRAVSRHGGEMAHGARHGVRAGQYYEVRRGQALIGHVHVDAVSEDSARVSLVRGAPRLQPGDRLAEGETVQVWEVGLSAAPNLLAHNDERNELGVATAAHLMLYEPVSASIYGLVVEHLVLPGFSRWRAGLDYGRQLRVLPRRLFAYARVGLGVVRASQDLDEELIFEDGELRSRRDAGVATGFELLPSLGVKLTLGEGVVLHASVSYPVALHGSNWNRASDRKLRVRDDRLSYPHPHQSMPTLSLGAGWRF